LIARPRRPCRRCHPDPGTLPSTDPPRHSLPRKSGAPSRTLRLLHRLRPGGHLKAWPRGNQHPELAVTKSFVARKFAVFTNGKMALHRKTFANGFPDSSGRGVAGSTERRHGRWRKQPPGSAGVRGLDGLCRQLEATSELVVSPLQRRRICRWTKRRSAELPVRFIAESESRRIDSASFARHNLPLLDVRALRRLPFH